MVKKLLYNPFNVTLLVITILTIYTFLIRFYTPDLPNLSIDITYIDYNTELQQITFTLDTAQDEYFLLIYEEDLEEQWLYFNSSVYHNLDIAKIFLPAEIEKFILFEGDSSTTTFSFEVKPKHAFSYMDITEYVFHVQLIIPFKFSIFPTFYYTKHYVFFLESSI
ncbi:MAG: hypothetical protein ATN34_01600 [Epulopiscium sp. Nele67-Bin002]|nr:MAG: hypothetical protein BEN18_05560 [Epulopiscium sp. Nuni2H_MBin001]OON90865.1 MAG: hypothetical protein ATN34_01600 [Epulopiscium sp. Nele67-Bin002]OON91793.1 MAG: hypothetical protein ATN33_08505 [Epulopiscium sp. Nele67-Bin001]